MSKKRAQRLETQVDADILAALNDLAGRRGYDIDALVGEALADLLEKHGLARPRPDVMDAYGDSHATFAPLYKKLAE